MSSITLGIIGYGNHAKKLISIIEKIENTEIKYVFHPRKTFQDIRVTNEFQKLLECDAIAIVSPNETHFEYLKKIIENYSGYIFCEKPPVTNIKEIKNLIEFSESQKNKIFFNFMMRFGKINEILKSKLNSEEIGKTIRIDVWASKGLAFKQDYLNSWRADGEMNLYNILDAKSIHFLDLFNFHLGEIKKISVFPSLISNNGTSYDTISLIFEYENNVILSIFNSYATPLLNEISILGTNGQLAFRENKITIKSPRDVFDQNGLFISPPITYSEEILIEDDYQVSLEKAMNYFISTVKNKEKFEVKLFEKSVETNQIILDIKEMMEQEKK